MTQLWWDGSLTTTSPTTGRRWKHLEGWCRQNNLCINVKKTKEMIVDRHLPPPLYVGGTAVEVVSSFRYLGVHISDDLTWSNNTSSLIRKAHQRLYFLRRLRRAGLGSSVLTSFYRCVVESVLSSCIIVWHGSCSAAEKKALQRVVKAAQRTVGRSLPTTTDILHLQMQETGLLHHEGPHSHCTQTVCPPLPSGRRLRSIKSRQDHQTEEQLLLPGSYDLFPLRRSHSFDFLPPNKFTKRYVRLSDPGPHVFLLVLQPEDFTEEHKLRLCRVLKLFSDRSFDHSLVLISTPREESPGFMENYREHPPLKDMIRKCRYRYLKLKNLERSELLTRLGQIVKENNGEHVSCDVFEDAPSTLPGDHQSPEQKEIQTSITGAVKAAGLSVLLPSSEKNLLTHMRREVKSCVTLCPPGPNVLLLLVKSSKFSEENRQTLKFIFTLFGRDALKHSMVIVTHERKEMSVSVDELLKDCGGRHYNMGEDNHRSLMEKIEKIVHENKGTFLTFTEETSRPKSEHIKPALNLVLCGRTGAGKTSAAKAILGQTEFSFSLQPIRVC
ncbi:hypothetical protein L3Q82_007008 [Scortum barcoo]|uniref:Uncharacterized protein n=1 Tax=Scortum barcoo TaxID=214431 RepID=A0ACB8WWE6_9TELE|nr:hypothetical protein L3Q82_007008 [Scortum barcoo]